jgi:ABC-2 type transport system ATP-binding protein
MGTNNAIVVNNLQKSFKELQVLRGLDFTVDRGTILALLGPNGAGKTTTIRVLSTLLVPDGGYAEVNGYNVVEQSDEVRGSIGLTGQFAAVDEYLTGLENLQMMGGLYHLSTEETNRRSQELLEQFDLMDASNRPVKTYSGGMRRRLDLAMSLIASPPILFLDEPTTGLDPRSRLTMWEMIKQLVAKGTTILLTTQYMEEADQLADRIVVIDNGKVIAEGTADTLKNQVGSDRLEVVIDKASDFEAAQKVIDGEALQTNPERRTISIATRGGVKELRQVLQRLEEAQIEVGSVSLHRPTLDDVFLTLTGHAASTDSAENHQAHEKEGKNE